MITPIMYEYLCSVCVRASVCVCVRIRERDKDREIGENIDTDKPIATRFNREHQF